MRVFVGTLAVFSTLLMSGCGWLYGKDGWIRDTEYDYLEVKQSPPLKIPEGMQGYKPTDAYPIPPLTEAMVKTAPKDGFNVEPPALVLSAGEGVVGVQDAAVATGLVYVEAETLWSRLISFLEKKQIGILEQDQTAGVIRTDWVQTESIGWFRDWIMDQDIEAYRWKFVISTQAGENPKENRLTVKVDQSEALSENQGWIPNAIARRDGVDMLNQFLGFYDEELTKDARARVLASRAGVPVELWQGNEGEAGIFARLDIDQLWEITPTVIEKLGFIVDDKDTTKHLYYTTLTHESVGFWNWLFGGSGQNIDLKEGEYVFELKSVADGTAVIISIDGETLKTDKLKDIFPQLQQAYQERRSEFNRAR